MKIINTNKLERSLRRDHKRNKHIKVKISDKIFSEDSIKDRKKRKLRKKRKERIRIKEEMCEQ